MKQDKLFNLLDYKLIYLNSVKIENSIHFKAISESLRSLLLKLFQLILSELKHLIEY